MKSGSNIMGNVTENDRNIYIYKIDLTIHILFFNLTPATPKNPYLRPMLIVAAS